MYDIVCFFGGDAGLNMEFILYIFYTLFFSKKHMEFMEYHGIWQLGSGLDASLMEM